MFRNRLDRSLRPCRIAKKTTLKGRIVKPKAKKSEASDDAALNGGAAAADAPAAAESKDEP